jgi:hypothetical protein
MLNGSTCAGRQSAVARCIAAMVLQRTRWPTPAAVHRLNDNDLTVPERFLPMGMVPIQATRVMTVLCFGEGSVLPSASSVYNVYVRARFIRRTYCIV